jgi:hypothetical protein
MRGRTLRSTSLVALLSALILLLGAALTFSQSEAKNRERDVFDRKPDKGTRDFPHKAGRVTIWFTKALVKDNADQATSITVEDSCGRILSNNTTTSWNRSGSHEDWVGKASVVLDRRSTNPKGLYYVTAEYWLKSDEGEPSEDPGQDDPPAAQARTYTYKFNVHGGPNCDGSGGGDHPGHGGGGNGNGDKTRVWGSTSGDDHDHDGGHLGHENLRTAGSTSSTHDDHNSSTYDPFNPYTSPTIPSSDDHSDHITSSTSPFGEDDFGDPFGESTGNSPISDPTDPSLSSTEPGLIPEEAEDQQTLTATPIEDLGPESGTLVVALATALLLGVGGGLFLRRTDPAPIRRRS